MGIEGADPRLQELAAIAGKTEPDWEPSPMVGWVSGVVAYALDAGIPCLRVIDTDSGGLVERLADGTFVPLLEVPRRRGSLVTLFKLCSEMDIAQTRRAQTGWLRHERPQRQARFPAETILDGTREAYVVRFDPAPEGREVKR